MGAVAMKFDSRRDMQAPDHLFGIGLVFPDWNGTGSPKRAPTIRCTLTGRSLCLTRTTRFPEDREDSLYRRRREGGPEAVTEVAEHFVLLEAEARKVVW